MFSAFYPSSVLEGIPLRGAVSFHWCTGAISRSQLMPESGASQENEPITGGFVYLMEKYIKVPGAGRGRTCARRSWSDHG